MAEWLLDSRTKVQETKAIELQLESKTIRLNLKIELCGTIKGLEAIAKTEPHDHLGSLTLLLNQLDHDEEATHDEEVEQGMATSLVMMLHKTMLQPGDQQYRGHIGRSRALRVSIICSALEIVFRCSATTMKAYIDTKPAEMLPTLLTVIELFMSRCGSNTVREVVLHKTTRILNRLCVHGLSIEKDLVKALMVLLKADLSTDTRIDASCALASLAATSNVKHSTLEKIEHASRSLVSTLTTAASSVPHYQAEEIFDALVNLASSMDIVLVHIARRGCTLRVLCQGMKSVIPELRHNSYMIAKNLLRCNASFVELLSTKPANGRIILQGLTTAVLNEDVSEMQHYATCTLTETLVNMNSSLDHIEIITDSLIVVAAAAMQDRTANEAGIALCNKAPALEEPSGYRASVFIAVASLAQSSSGLVRAEALRALAKLCTRESTRRFLAEQKSFQQAILWNITKGNDEAVSAAIAILGQLACEPDPRDTIRRTTLLEALVSMLTKRNITNGAAYVSSVELLLTLMSDDSSIKCFLPFVGELLPWLAALANSTTSSNQFKKDLVNAIIRLTSTILE
jgi:hypothetical protein